MRFTLIKTFLFLFLFYLPLEVLEFTNQL
jgi:hypothetical protein